MKAGYSFIDASDGIDLKSVIKTKNDSRLSELGVSDLLAQYSINGQRRPLSEGCLIQKSYNNSVGLQKMINITSVNLVDHSVSSLYVGGNYKAVGMTPRSIFLAGSYIDAGGNDQRAKRSFIPLP